ncbi:trypsin-like peptidase domain-containing protein [Promicromonospora sukumoe]
MNIESLLSQATCEVIDVDGVTGRRDASLGTAWLVSDQGHLLTAAHVVAPMWQAAGAEARVHVRFPTSASGEGTSTEPTSTEPASAETESTETATFTFAPVHDRARNLDLAVLQLTASTTRSALPVVLAAEAEGDVLVCGYGQNTRGWQRTGRGRLVGKAIRGGDSDGWMFQYESPMLVHRGFSGGAVWSVSRNGVIGLQTLAELPESVVVGPGAAGPSAWLDPTAAFAMPLVRMIQDWPDLRALDGLSRQGTCVLVQSADGDARRRAALRDDVVVPVLRELGLELYESQPGDTAEEDLRQLEDAAVVLADISHEDPGVTYELGVAQALGVPDVVIVDTAHRPGGASMFQVLELDTSDPAGSRERLAERLVDVRSVFATLGRADSDNPLTSYFRTPLTQISAANALSLGYLKNFVRPVSQILRRLRHDPGSAHLTVGGRRLKPAQIATVTLTVVLPEHLSWAQDDFIAREIAETGHIVDAVLDDNLSRPRSMKALPPRRGEPLRLLDVFPTTMSAMSDTIEQRVAHLGVGGEETARLRTARDELEAKEIDRFHLRLLDRVRQDTERESGRLMRDVVRVERARAVFPGLDPGLR